jgi:hypothetical protein
MPSERDIARGIHGAWRLFLLDARAIDDFDLSMRGFWQSFWAMAIVAPLYLLYAVPQPALIARLSETAAPDYDPALYLQVKALIFVTTWLFFPLIMVPLSRVLDLGHRYVPLIVAYNWSHVIVIVLVLPPAMLYWAGLIGGGIFIATTLGIQLFVVYYRWFVTRAALQSTALMAIALVAIDVMASILIGRVMDGWHGAYVVVADQPTP